MNINTVSYKNNLSQNTPVVKPHFKGYFACPIKELHFETFNTTCRRYPIIKELQKKCGKYFDILVQTAEEFVEARKFKKPETNPKIQRKKQGFFTRYHEFGQDNKLFTENGMLLLEGCDDFGWEEGETLAKHLNLTFKNIQERIQGGNCFFGKKPNGEDFALLGQDALLGKKSKPKSYIDQKIIAKSLGIKPENIYVIPQPDFYLDMAIRPLKYPYILVDDYNLTIEMAKNKKQRTYIADTYYTSSQKEYIEEEGYSTPKQTAENLSKLGFKPILVPGSLGFYRRNVNYLNAIVHQDTDGRLIYITNHSKCGRSFWDGVNMEKTFAKYLKEKCPEVKDVIFIDGKGMINRALVNSEAGIHCLTSENPDFEKWKTMLG